MWKNLGLVVLFASSVACGSNNSTVLDKYGSIALDSASEGAGVALAPRAFFYKYTGSGSGVCDVTLDDGACRVWNCNDDAYTSLPGITVLDAGDVAVTGTKQELALSRADDGRYTIPDFDVTVPLWDGGETLTANVSGGADVPVASIALQAPPVLTVTAPVIPEGGLALDARSDFPLAWTPLSTADSVYIAISAATDVTLSNGEVIENLTPALDCKFTGSTGAGVVRAALLTAMPKPAALKHYQLDMLTFAYKQQRVEDMVFELRASWLGLTTQPTLQQ